MLLFLGLLALAILAMVVIDLALTRRETRRLDSGHAPAPTDDSRDITLSEYVSGVPHPLHGTTHLSHERR